MKVLPAGCRALRRLVFWGRCGIFRRRYRRDAEKRIDGIMDMFPLRRDQGQLGFALLGKAVVGARRAPVRRHESQPSRTRSFSKG